MSYINKGSMPATVTVSVEPDRSGNFVCDGTADQVEILAAIAYMVALYGGGTVHIKTGTYNIAASIAITDHDVNLEGEGNITILIASADVDLITFTGVGVWPNVLRHGGVRDLNIEGFGSSHTGYGIKLSYSDWLYINNVYFSECYICLYGRYGGNYRITSNHIYAWYNMGFEIWDAESIIVGNSFDISRAAGEGAAAKRAIYMPGGSNVINDNVIEGVYGASGDGLYITGSRNTVVGNHINTCDRWGMVLTGVSVIIVGNYLYDNGSSGIRTDTDYSVYVGNVLIDNGAYGIDLAGGSGSNIVKNNIYSGNATAPIIDVGTNNRFHTAKFQFQHGGNGAGIQTGQFIHTDASAKGWEIDATDEWAIALGQMPLECQFVIRIKIWGVNLAAAGGAGVEMLVDVLVNAGGSDEPFTTEQAIVASKPSVEDNLPANDVIHWMIDAGDDTDIDEIVGGDSVEVKVVYRAGNADLGTDAIFRAVEFEYV